MHSGKNDNELWAAFLKGDQQVLSLIYLLHVNALFDYGCRISSDHDLIKDCIQDTFFTILKNRRTLSPTNNVRLYLFKAFKRKLIRELQKKTRYLQINAENGDRFEINFLKSFDHAELEVTEEQKQKLLEAVNILSARQREAIYLRFIRGMDYRDISVIMDLNYQSSRALIHRAIGKLREALHGESETFSRALLFILRSCRK
ncbi:MAG: RNA polymerase sigma factor [Prolixibacteraceae bacterium]